VKGGVQPGHKVLVPSIGSGVSQFVVQFAIAAGAEVWVTSSSDDKLNTAMQKLKIKGSVNYKNKNWVKELISKSGKFDVIIDGVGGEFFPILITDALKNGGKMVTYGATAGAPKRFPLHQFFLQQKYIIGSTMGSDKNFKDMLSFTISHKVVPLISSVSPFHEIKDVIEQMKEDKCFGKLVVTFQNNAKL